MNMATVGMIHIRSPNGAKTVDTGTDSTRSVTSSNHPQDKVIVIQDSIDKAPPETKSSKSKSHARRSKSSSKARFRRRQYSFTSTSSDSSDDQDLIASARLNAQANLRVEDMLSFSGFSSLFNSNVLSRKTEYRHFQTSVSKLFG